MHIKRLGTRLGNEKLQPLIAVRPRLQLPSALFRVDLDVFDPALRRAAGLPDTGAPDEYERDLALYGGGFLEGEFFPWADTYRLEYRQRLAAAARRAAAIADSLGQPERAARHFRMLIERELTDESAV